MVTKSPSTKFSSDKTAKDKFDVTYIKMLIREHKLLGIRRLKFQDLEVIFQDTQEQSAVTEQPPAPVIESSLAVAGGPLGLGRYDEVLAEEDELTPDKIQFPGPVRH